MFFLTIDSEVITFVENIDSFTSKRLGNTNVWFMELRAPFFTASLLSVILGTAIAWSNQRVFDPRLFLLTLIGVLCLHAGTNIANDYFDHTSGNDDLNHGYLHPFTGGSRVIQNGYLSPNSIISASILFFGAGSFIGLYLYWVTKGTMILVLMIVGIVSGFFYSSPPFKFENYGFGELLVALNFGVLVTIGSFYVQTLSINLEVIAASIPLGLLVAAILYVNEFPDYEADKMVGKNNLVVILGKEKAVNGYIAIISSAYLFLTVFAITGLITIYALIGLLTIPLAFKAIKNLRKNFNNATNLTPACTNTIKTHIFSGILITIGYLFKAVL